jgi:hypothetical protein
MSKQRKWTKPNSNETHRDPNQKCCAYGKRANAFHGAVTGCAERTAETDLSRTPNIPSKTIGTLMFVDTVTDFSSAVAVPAIPIDSKNLFAEITAEDLSMLGFPLRNEVTCCAPARAAFSAASVASIRAAIIRPPSNARPAHATNVMERTTTNPEIDPRSLWLNALMEFSKYQ